MTSGQRSEETPVETRWNVRLGRDGYVAFCRPCRWVGEGRTVEQAARWDLSFHLGRSAHAFAELAHA